MKKVVLDYKEKHHILSVDGIDYEIPRRTAEIMEKIKENNEKVEKTSEYDSNMNLLSILFGEKAAKQMFPDKETTDLDKLVKCSRIAVALFMSEMNIILNENISKLINENEYTD